MDKLTLAGTVEDFDGNKCTVYVQEHAKAYRIPSSCVYSDKFAAKRISPSKLYSRYSQALTKHQVEQRVRENKKTKRDTSYKVVFLPRDSSPYMKVYPQKSLKAAKAIYAHLCQTHLSVRLVVRCPTQGDFVLMAMAKSRP